MLSWQLIRLGVRSLLLHKLRSALTILGIVFGVASVVSILAVGEGASYEVQAQLRRLGPDRVLLRSVLPPDIDTSRSTRLDFGLTNADLARIESLVPGLAAVAPSYEIEKRVHVGMREILVPLIGTTPSFTDIHRLEVARGRFLCSVDLEARANVAVLGSKVARSLFGAIDPVGQDIKLGSGLYRIVGLLRPAIASASVTHQPDESVFIPLTTARMRLEDVARVEVGGARRYEYVQLHQIGLRVHNLAQVEQVAGMLRRLLTVDHNRPDYDLVVPFELLRQAERTKRVFSLVLGSIAAISLLVGGIGIMNIMLATVTERTREIGVRRAVGAQRMHILHQFLVETVVLSASGGVLGLGLGLAIPWAIESVSNVRTIVTPGSMALSLGISVLVGVVFGVYPARRAAGMDPIEALRYG
jgi:putative ABC transport system permease protein